MPAIIIGELVEFVKEWLPKDANCLTDAQIAYIGNQVISVVCEDVPVDDQDPKCYPEVRCKTLLACAEANQALSPSQNGGLKREKTYMEEVEYHQGNGDDIWDKYIKGLPDICIIFGYNGLRSKSSTGFFANVATPVQAPLGAPPYGSMEKLLRDLKNNPKCLQGD